MLKKTPRPSKRRQYYPEEVELSIEDPNSFHVLKKIIQSRQDNLGKTEAMIDECTERFIERCRSRQQKKISASTLGHLRRGTYKVGGVDHMIKEKARKEQEEKTQNDTERATRKKAKLKLTKRKIMSRYNKTPVIESAERIEEVSHESAITIVERTDFRYDTVFQIMNVYYKKKFLEKGIVIRSQRATFCYKLRKLIKDVKTEELFHEITLKVLEQITLEGHIRWQVLFEKYQEAKK